MADNSPQSDTQEALDTCSYLVDIWSVLESRDGNTVFHQLSSFPGPIKPFKSFVARHVTQSTVDQRDKNGNTALMLAVRGGFADKVQVLIDAGADVGISNNASDTPLSYACYRSRPVDGILDILLSSPTAKHAIGIIDSKKSTLLLHAVNKLNGDLVSKLLEAKANPNQASMEGVKPLDTLINTSLGSLPTKSKLNILRDLISAGVSVKDRDKDGFTYLHKAVKKKNRYLCFSFIKQLLDAGASPWIPDADGYTPFDVAASATKVDDDVLVSMLDHRAPDCKAIVDKYNSLLMSSLKSGSERLVSAMLRAGACVTREINEVSPLFYICVSADEAMAARLIKDIQCDDRTLGIWVISVVEEFRVNVLRALKDAGAWMGHLSLYSGNHALMSACLRPYTPQLASILIDDKSLLHRNYAGRTALFFAVESGNPALVQLLLDAGAETTVEDDAGLTMLMIGADDEVLDVLLKGVYNELGIDLPTAENAESGGGLTVPASGSNGDDIDGAVVV
jgi:ankyrin repeat protein